MASEAYTTNKHTQARVHINCVQAYRKHIRYTCIVVVTLLLSIRGVYVNEAKNKLLPPSSRRRAVASSLEECKRENARQNQFCLHFRAKCIFSVRV